MAISLAEKTWPDRTGEIHLWQENAKDQLQIHSLFLASKFMQHTDKL